MSNELRLEICITLLEALPLFTANIRAEEFVSQLLHHTEEFRTQREIDAQEEVFEFRLLNCCSRLFK